MPSSRSHLRGRCDPAGPPRDLAAGVSWHRAHAAMTEHGPPPRSMAGVAGGTRSVVSFIVAPSTLPSPVGRRGVFSAGSRSRARSRDEASPFRNGFLSLEVHVPSCPPCRRPAGCTRGSPRCWSGVSRESNVTQQVPPVPPPSAGTSRTRPTSAAMTRHGPPS
jgi:hypothetical protein